MSENVFFNYSLLSPVLSGEKTHVFFEYDLNDTSPTCFLVRPKITKGFIEIKVINDYKNEVTWMGQNDLWTKMPIVSEDLEIRSKNIGVEGADLSFDILDTCSGKLISTTAKRVWLDTSIKQMYAAPEITYGEILGVSTSVSTDLNPPQFLGVFIKSFLIVFFVSLVFLTVVKYRNEKDS